MYIVSLLLLKVKLFLYNEFFIKFYLNIIQPFYIKALYHVLYILHIDEIFNLLKNFNILNKIKYREDPLLFRNYFLKMPLSLYDVYINFKNSLIHYKFSYGIIYFKDLFLIFAFQIIYKFSFYNKCFYLYNFFLKKAILIFFLKKNHINKSMVKAVCLFVLYIFNVVIINLIYLSLTFVLYFFYFTLYNCIKLKKWFVYFITILLLLKYF
jgi:hypothetical protein